MAATSTSRLIFRRAAPTSRWLCTSTETVAVKEVPTTTVSEASKVEATAPSPTSKTKEKARESTVLFKKLVALGKPDSNGEVAQILDGWVKEGHSITRNDIIGFATELRKYKKTDIAAQAYKWFDKSKKKMNNADRAVLIDLLATSEGLTAAENYFNKLPNAAKTAKTYGSLLKCYCREKMLEAADNLFKEISELNFHTNSLSYNNMMALYIHVGRPERVPLLFKEMEERRIAPDLYAYNLLMNSYAALKDIDSVDGVLEKMKMENVKFDWLTYGNLATIYVNAGLTDEATATLQTLEKTKKAKDPEAYHSLINLYGRLSDAEGVNRSWNSLKSSFPKPYNLSYLIMLLALWKLGDFDGLEMVFKEWESACSNYDIRLPNVLLESYLNRDMLDKMDSLSKSISERDGKLNLRTHDLLMKLYLKKGRIDLALKHLEDGVSKANSKNTWFPKEDSVDAFTKCLEEVNDVGAAERFNEIMKKVDRLDSKPECLIHNTSAEEPAASDV